MILIDAISQWMEMYKKASVKQATYDRMRTSLTLMEKYEIAAIEISRLSSADLQRYINQLVSDGYALTTIKKQFNLISGYLRFAVSEGIVSKPIYTSVKLPSQALVAKQKKDVVAYTEDEQTRLKRELSYNGKEGSAIVSFMMETGLRVGEVLALRWEDINLPRRSVSIRRTLVRLANSKQSYVQNSPKSHASNRIIPLSEQALLVLSRVPHTSEYVFGKKEYEPFSYEALRNQVKSICKASHVEYYGMHVFRHTFATNCYNKGCDVKLLSKMLGHSSVSVTYNTYIHLYGDALEAMRAIV